MGPTSESGHLSYTEYYNPLIKLIWSHDRDLINLPSKSSFFNRVAYVNIFISSDAIGTIMKFLSPDALLVHASIKLHFSLSLVISQTKQKQNTKQRFLYMNSFPIRRSIIQ